MCDSCGYPGDTHYTLGVAYPADRVDGHGDFMKAATVQETAWNYIKKGREIGLQHIDGTVGHADVVESYIYRGPDWTLRGPSGKEQVVKSGDWLLGVVWDAPTWRLIKSGHFRGWSIQGAGTRRRIGKEEQ